MRLHGSSVGPLSLKSLSPFTSFLFLIQLLHIDLDPTLERWLLNLTERDEVFHSRLDTRCVLYKLLESLTLLVVDGPIIIFFATNTS